MFLLNGKTFDIEAQHTIAGVQYPIGYFRDPAARFALGITQPQTQPEGPKDERFFINTQSDNGTWASTPRDPAQFVVPLCAKIDAAADQAYERIAGSGGRVAEYQRAYDEAAAFKAANYLGESGVAVASWAAIKGWTPRQAADDILSARAQFDQALYGIREIRLAAKETVRNAVTAQDKYAAADEAISLLNGITID